MTPEQRKVVFGDARFQEMGRSGKKGARVLGK